MSAAVKASAWFPANQSASHCKHCKANCLQCALQLHISTTGWFPAVPFVQECNQCNLATKVKHCQGRLFFAAFACGLHFSLITAVNLASALVSLGSALPPLLFFFLRSASLPGSLPWTHFLHSLPVAAPAPSWSSLLCKNLISQSFRMSLLGSWGPVALATLASSTSAFSLEGLTSELGLSEALMEGEPR